MKTASFEAYYAPLATLIRTRSLQGLDLDIEEPVTLSTATRLISRLRADFGPDFIITLAPVATALLPDPRLTPAQRPPRPMLAASGSMPNPLHPTLPHLSGFSYPELECSVFGREISWYNTQFYCGWGDASSTQGYDAIVAAGWHPSRVVMGVVTNLGNGAGHVGLRELRGVLARLRTKYTGQGGFGGVMGWEWFNSGQTETDMTHIATLDINTSGQSIRSSPQASWVAAIGTVLRSEAPPLVVEQPAGPASFLGNVTSEQIRQMVTQLPEPSTPWPNEKVDSLIAIGFERHEAVAALNATDGNAELAANLLFEQ
ncbi:glycoside hydrolase [Delitschia confertaspora ATCC 74209]|uniref:Glycoside hydrolase n=1 Tax=Delitschia confertaspora ATCC 74209 TaxID=1513339 RepID=A0A9P4JEQ2_9PLEO|nr:glycoside hydrolase [Delitschia confertaspora ATCC 74209]